MKKYKRPYNKNEILQVLRQECFNMSVPDIEIVAKIFSHLTYVGLKRVARVAALISKGTD